MLTGSSRWDGKPTAGLLSFCNLQKMLKFSFKFLCLAYRIYNVLGATDLHNWWGEKGGERAAGVREEIPKEMLEISFIFLCLA